MSEAVIVAVITGAFAVLGQWLIARQQAAKRKTDEAVRDARQEDRLTVFGDYKTICQVFQAAERFTDSAEG